MLPLELVERLDCATISTILSRSGFGICAYSLTSSDAENENCERYNAAARSSSP